MKQCEWREAESELTSLLSKRVEFPAASRDEEIPPDRVDEEMSPTNDPDRSRYNWSNSKILLTGVGPVIDSCESSNSTFESCNHSMI